MGSTMSNDQSQDETHQNTPHNNTQHSITQYPSNTIPMDNFLIAITNGWKLFLKDHWRWNQLTRQCKKNSHSSRKWLVFPILKKFGWTFPMGKNRPCFFGRGKNIVAVERLVSSPTEISPMDIGDVRRLGTQPTRRDPRNKNILHTRGKFEHKKYH